MSRRQVAMKGERVGRLSVQPEDVQTISFTGGTTRCPCPSQANCPTIYVTRMAPMPSVCLLGVRRTRPPWSGLRSARSFARTYSHPVSRVDARHLREIVGAMFVLGISEALRLEEPELVQWD